MEKVLALSGATGYIGTELTKKLAPFYDKVVILVRSKSLEKAKQKFIDIPNIRYFVADITELDVLTSDSDLGYFIDKEITAVHLAAYYDIKAKKFDAYKQNLIGTMNILNMLKPLTQIKSFHYISTFAVNMGGDEAFNEEELQKNIDDLDYYAWSKNCTESFIRNHSPYLTRIYRPGIIVAPKNGKIQKIDGPYLLLKEFLSKKKYLDKLPGLHLPFSYNRKALLPFVSLDYFTDLLTDMIQNIQKPEKKIRSYHLIGDEPYTANRFMKDIQKELKLDKKIIPTPGEKIFATLFNKLKIPGEILSYLNNPSSYLANNLQEDFPDREQYNFNDHSELFFKEVRDKWGNPS